MGLVRAEFAQALVAELVGDEVSAVGGDADVAFAAVLLSLFDVAGELFFSIARFATEVALELDHGAAEEGVDASADLADVGLQTHVFSRYLQAVDEELPHVGPDGLVTGARGQFSCDLIELFARSACSPAKGPARKTRVTIPQEEGRVERGEK